MNKFKKVSIAAVSVVMAGSMAFAFAACGGGAKDEIIVHHDYYTSTDSVSENENATNMVSLLNTTYHLDTRLTAMQGGWATAKGYWNYLQTTVSDPSQEGGGLTYTKDTEIPIAIGYNSASTGAFYASSGSNAPSGGVTVPGSYMAVGGGIKPAFSAIQDALGVKFSDEYSGASTSANITNLVSDGKWTNNTWSSGQVAVATTDLSVAVSQANTAQNMLNLADYLDKMPNFKYFLESNPVVYLSLLQDGLNTATGEGQSLYVAPYFDGYDDIERYCLVRQDWVVDLLDSDNLTYDGDTYKDACAEETAVTSGWMGTTGSYTIETTTADGEGTYTLKKDYDAAKTAAADPTTPLGAAYEAIAGVAYEGASGNIVDIMNAAIAVNNGATGKQLATLYSAYIDVAYQDESGNAAYSTKSNLFNGYDAAWDVDDLVAMLRIVKTNSKNVGLDPLTTTGIFPREANNDRTPDIVSLTGQLYGVRGVESRYEYSYIDNNGELQDARNDVEFWTALENMGCLADEGLLVNYVDNTSLNGTELKGDCKENPGTGFMEYDYSQTQTTQMYDLNDDSVDQDYMYGAINTPVSYWDTSSDGTRDTYMRFTESWRSTKTSGLCVSAAVATDENLLNAVLTFIDYIYSNDGQILSTYGVQSTKGNTDPDGTWYGNEVTSVSIDTVATKVGGQYVVDEEYQSQYFCFNDTLYTGTLYKGKQTPIITDELYNSFISNSSSDPVYTTFSQRGSFTGYARAVLGATLPMGVKDQSFENQLTATQAAAAATKVSVSISNGTIKHTVVDLTGDYWYWCVPTGLPTSTSQQNNLDASTQSDLKYMTGTKKDDKNFYSIFHWIIMKGYAGQYNQQGVVVNFS